MCKLITCTVFKKGQSCPFPNTTAACCNEEPCKDLNSFWLESYEQYIKDTNKKID
jgi:hypothetical protein